MTLSLRRPSRRYDHSWVTQRLLNRGPEWSRARSFPFSVAQQLLNPLGLEIEETLKGLTEERYNSFISTANPFLMDRVFEADLPENLSFTQAQTSDGVINYSEPTVYAMVDSAEEEIFIAENNDIETFWYDCLPTRIEYGEESNEYVPIVDTTVEDLSSASIADIDLPGHLYLTVGSNTNWQEESKNRIYFSKIFLEGTLRKGVEEITEAVPIRYNSTFRTLNQWSSIDQITSAYLSDDAEITIGSLPFAAESSMDKRNIHVPIDGDERFQFIRLGSQSWGSTIAVESFTDSNMDVVRLGYEEKENVYELELKDVSGNNVSLNAVAVQPGTDRVIGISNSKVYIFSLGKPSADVDNLDETSADAKMEIGTDKWWYVRGETAKLWTRLQSFAEVPVSTRWLVHFPDDSEYYLGLDGSLWALTTDAWILNSQWEYGLWDSPKISFLLEQTGTYTIRVECKYFNEDSGESYTRTSKMTLITGSRTAEQEFSLPTELQNCTNLAYDSDGKLWFYKSGNIYLANFYYDYFMVDYERRKIILREQYSEIRVVT